MNGIHDQPCRDDASTSLKHLVWNINGISMVKGVSTERWGKSGTKGEVILHGFRLKRQRFVRRSLSL
jgi:hypothetical protein